MKHFRFFTLTLLAVLAVSAFSGMAVAQNGVKVTFQLDEQLHWGKAVLTPGAYTMTLNSLAAPIHGVLRSEDGKIVALTFASTLSDPTPQKTFIEVSGTGPERRVLSLNLPAFGLAAVYSELTRAEKEEIAKAKKFSGVDVALR